MPTPRNPILVDVNTTFRNWQAETNALTNIMNYFIRSSDGAFVADNAELTNVTISGGTISDVNLSGVSTGATFTGTTFSGSTLNDSTLNQSTINQSHIVNPTVSGYWDFTTATLSIKSGNDTERLAKGVGTPVEFFYNFSDNLLYVFDGTVEGGRAFSPTTESIVPDAGQITIIDTAGRYDALNVEDALAEIAGAGRLTTETVASNADDITDLYATKVEASRQIIVSSGLTGGGTLANDVFIEHLNTSEITNVTDSGASGVAITGMQFDSFGHATDRQTYDFDDRYYTESEADERFLNEADNLADLPDVATARENLGLGVDDIVNIGRIDENVVAVSGVATYDILDTSYNVFAVNTFANAVTINLPTLADNIGRKIYLINVTAENDIVISSEVGDTIGPNGETIVEVAPTVTTTILVGTPTYWEQVATGGGGASVSTHLAANDITFSQPLALSPGTQSIAQEVTLSGTSFSDPIDAYFVLDLATDIRAMVFFADNETDAPPAVGQTHSLRVWKTGGFASIADLISEASTQLAGQFGIVYAGTGALADNLYIDISMPDSETLSMFTVGAPWSALNTSTATPTIDSTGKVIVADKRYRYAVDVVGLANETVLANDDVGAQKIARMDETISGVTGGNLTPGLPCFLGDGGTIIQDASQILLDEHRVYLGLAIAVNSIDVSIEEGVAISSSPQYWDAHPLGGIAFSSTTTLPEGWLRPNGQVLSRSNYSQLNAWYAAEGYPHGAGDGSTTFNLPNYDDPAAMIKVRYVEPRTQLEANDIDVRLTDVEALLKQPGTSITSDYTATSNDNRLVVDPSLGAVNVTVDPAVSDVLDIRVKHSNALMDRADCESTEPPAISGLAAETLDMTAVRSSEQSRSGLYSYKLNKTVAAGVGGANLFFHPYTATTSLHGLVPGATYTVSTWMYLPSASPIQIENIYLLAYDNTNSRTIGPNAYTTKKDTWQKLETTFTVPSTGTSSVWVYIQMGSSTALNSYVYIDDLQLYRHYDVNILPVSGASIGGVNSVLLESDGDELRIFREGDEFLIDDYSAHGKNENGEWSRYADGTMIVTGLISISVAAADGYAAGVESFPVAFSSVPSMSASVSGYNVAHLFYGSNATGYPTATQHSMSFRDIDAVARTGTFPAYWTATGRWRA